jgi:hypothetical protein
LIAAGSGSADIIGLYQYTTQTNQVKQGMTQVDIGLHYVALSPSGKPLDENSDGVPDYLEDVNGNGLYDPANGETDWRTPPNGITGSPGLQVFTPLK